MWWVDDVSGLYVYVSKVSDGTSRSPGPGGRFVRSSTVYDPIRGGWSGETGVVSFLLLGTGRWPGTR